MFEYDDTNPIHIYLRSVGYLVLGIGLGCIAIVILAAVAALFP